MEYVEYILSHQTKPSWYICIAQLFSTDCKCSWFEWCYSVTIGTSTNIIHNLKMLYEKILFIMGSQYWNTYPNITKIRYFSMAAICQIRKPTYFQCFTQPNGITFQKSRLPQSSEFQSVLPCFTELDFLSLLSRPHKHTNFDDGLKAFHEMKWTIPQCSISFAHTQLNKNDKNWILQ